MFPEIPEAYIHRFGEGSFIKARSHLENIVFAREVNTALKQYEEKTGIQVRFVPKVHR